MDWVLKKVTSGAGFGRLKRGPEEKKKGRRGKF